MGFFETFWTWLNGQLARYIGDTTAHVSMAMEPAIMTLGILYVMIWGYLHLTGRIQEPFIAGLKRILMLGLVLGVALRMWLYNTIIVDTFYNAPAELATFVVGVSDPVRTVDSIWEKGGTVAGYLWINGGVLQLDFSYNFIAIVVWVLMGLLCVYTMFLIALSHVALAILLALGPFFIVMLLFESTKRLFDGWLAQLTNYGLITLLTVMAAALLLQVVNSFAAQTAARGKDLLTVDALNMILMAVLVFLLMRQVMPIAASLAGGAALNTMGLVSRVINMGARAGSGMRQRRRQSAAAFYSGD